MDVLFGIGFLAVLAFLSMVAELSSYQAKTKAEESKSPTDKE